MARSDVTTQPGRGPRPAGQAAEAVSDLPRGAVLGRYLVLERLGYGGMGTVYSAYDPELHRRVALKLVHSHLEDEELMRRLLREAQAMARLSHPNVVSVYDAGTWQGRVFVAMELIDGTTLRRALSTQPRPWREVLALFISCGRGLSAAHAAGLVHRDFKPDNVLLGKDGRARVTDFGLARLAADTEPEPVAVAAQPAPISATPLGQRLTEHGMLMGTPGYVAPELMTGQAADAASDQFSFCVSLYEALFGSQPFAGATLHEMATSASRGEWRVPVKPDGAPRWVRELLERGLSPRPEQRFPTLDALLDRLSADPAPRRRFGAAAVAASALLIGAAAAWSREKRTACDGLDGELARVWDPATRSRAQAAFAASGLPYQATAFARVDEQLGERKGQWLAARTEACRAFNVLDLETEGEHGLRVSCLDRRRDELEALGLALAEADGAAVERASGAVARLSRLETCADLPLLKKPLAGGSPISAAEARELNRALGSTRALLLTGRFEPAIAAAQPVLERAEALGVPRLAAEAAWVLGEAEHGLGRPESLPMRERGVLAALQASEDELLLRLLAGIVSDRGRTQSHPDEARALAPLADGVARRLGGEGGAVGQLHEAYGDVERLDGHFDAAAESYRRALERYVKEQGEHSRDVARVRTSLGEVSAELGHLDAANSELERALTILERVAGGGHPETTRALAALRKVAGQRGN
jgi:tRNA A-37 threonylcarbamoyl transferase component Bud32/tetratricopeptide (TPR) repeat protein